LTAALGICRKLSCKAVIVSPSTLVANWAAEVNKWFPSSITHSIITLSGGSNRSTKALDTTVRTFITSHSSVHPLLLLSYEMFRIYAPALDSISNLELVICDEGHRIKNALGTKTTQALGQSCAQRRLLLTGTPLQNNLDELFAVLQFVAPGYLGTLKEFQRDFGHVIETGRLPNATNSSKQKV
jgi:SNF2 family DNA or RNA helicase